MSGRKREDKEIISNLPLDCWCSIIVFFASRRDFLTLVLVVKGLYDYIKIIQPSCTINIPFFLKVLPSDYSDRIFSYVSNLLCDNRKRFIFNYLKGIAFKEFVKSFNDSDKEILSRHEKQKREMISHDWRYSRDYSPIRKKKKKFTTLKLFSQPYWCKVFPNLQEMCFIIQKNEEKTWRPNFLDVELFSKNLPTSLRKLKIICSCCNIICKESFPSVRDLTMSSIWTNIGGDSDMTKKLRFIYKDFPNLTRLHLHGFEIDEKSSLFINESLENCLGELVLSNITLKNVEFSRSPHLETLVFAGITNIPKLQNIKSLKHLKISAKGTTGDKRCDTILNVSNFEPEVSSFCLFNLPSLKSIIFEGPIKSNVLFPIRMEELILLRTVKIRNVVGKMIFKGIPNLEKLDIMYCDVDFEGTTDGLHLIKLQINNCNVGDGFVEKISQMKHLEEITVKSNWIYYQNPRRNRFSRFSPKKRINIDHSRPLSFENFQNLRIIDTIDSKFPLRSLSNCPKLENAEFSFSDNSDGNKVDELPLIKNLKVRLDSEDTEVFFDKLSQGKNVNIRKLEILISPKSDVTFRIDQIQFLKEIVISNFKYLTLKGERKEDGSCSLLEELNVENGEYVELIDLDLRNFQWKGMENGCVTRTDSREVKEET